jgi:hypothetical protein
MAKRKTIDVQYLVETVNEALRTSTTDPKTRLGMIAILEDVLHKTGNYRGYRYLTISEVPEGEHMPGVHYYGGEPLPYPDRFYNTDYTRIQYHTGE